MTARSISLYEGVGAFEQDLQNAREILGHGGILIASGMNQPVEERAGTEITFFANQFYLPIEAAIQPACSQDCK
ncbi:MAG: DUF6748 domain-containing protein [Methylococcales bacterium]